MSNFEVWLNLIAWSGLGAAMMSGLIGVALGAVGLHPPVWFDIVCGVLCVVALLKYQDIELDKRYGKPNK